ncbi:MAG: 50S ribosomal protein L3 [Candidatus Electryoneaceae bacterium]|nr:50S ribosomal protein L3 [Candidatus Electryoneaceae bacterium]
MITLLGRKKGMGAVFDDEGRHTPVTVLEVGPCQVLQVKTVESDGYAAVQTGFELINPKLVNKPRAGHFNRAGTKPYRLLREFRYDGNREFKTGEMLKVDHFKPGDLVIVTGTSKGRGFAGVIKRHGFHRPKQTHGTHESFRGTGSIGACSYPARVFPGKKMPGRMGGGSVTVKNLVVVDVDVEKGLLMVKGAVPGPPGGFIKVRKSGGVEL